MIVQLSYNVEVLAKVDTEAGTVESVRVLDEEISPNVNDEGYHVAYTEDGNAVPNERIPDAERALRIAERASWPGWSFG